MSSSTRNFSIIAHIDHGKSTLAERLLKHTQAASDRTSTALVFDSMDLERERGVTIKLKPVTFWYRDVRLNLIDTPGHVDFSYEVSRSLAAVEGALLVVDATQGVQAQTLAHFHVAQGLGLTIIPVINKIDLQNAEYDAVAQELVDLLGCAKDDIIAVSAKTGVGIDDLLAAIVERIPEPKKNHEPIPRGLIFDAVFDEFRGVIAYVRMVDGSITKGKKLHCVATKAESEILEVGRFAPTYTEEALFAAGDIGYVVTGLKALDQCRVGDTVTLAGNEVAALPGYREPQPMVYASLYPQEGNDATLLRRALEKLRLNDASLQFEGERSSALGLGFRCGFLGLFHLEIVQERLSREYAQDLVVTVPSVAYRIFGSDHSQHTVRAAQDFPDPTRIEHTEEPWITLHCIVPPMYVSGMMQLIKERRGIVENTEYIAGSAAMERLLVSSALPLAAVLTDFYDQVKSRSSGFASMYYEFLDYRPADVVRLDVLVSGERAEALSLLLVRSEAEHAGRAILLSLKKAIPPAMFEIRLQAALGGKIIASERIAPLRKDVIAGLYGGDVTRKRKLLEKQKKGKKRMLRAGHIELPASAYLAVLKKDSSTP